LQSGDRIAAINGTPIKNWKQLQTGIQNQGGILTTFTIVRAGHIFDVEITPTITDGVGKLGFYPANDFEHVSVIGAIPKSFETFGDIAAGSVQSIGRIFSPAGVSDYTKNFTSAAPKAGSAADLQRPTSVIGIVDQGSQLFDGNIWGILQLLGAISLILALFNLLPVLPFDGGHAVIVVYEGIMSKIKGRRVVFDIRKFIPISAIVVIFLMLISLSAMFLDIQRIGR